MGKVGCLGDVVFMVSTELIRTVDNVQWAGSVRIAEHQRHGTDALTEFTGIDADTISFDIYLSRALGVDPMEDIGKLWGYERAGKAVTLVLGEKTYGKYRWLIKSHKIKLQTFDGHGNLQGATVSLSLVEYLAE